jgi:hypothetical protein
MFEHDFLRFAGSATRYEFSVHHGQRSTLAARPRMGNIGLGLFIVNEVVRARRYRDGPIGDRARHHIFGKSAPPY